MRNLVLAVSCCLLAGPAAAGVPSEKDGTWIELQSNRFRVVTNAGEGAARQTAKRFEQMHEALASLTALQASDVPVLIVAPRDEGTLRTLIPEQWEGNNRGVDGYHMPSHFQDFLLLRTDLTPSRSSGYNLAYWLYAAQVISRNTQGLPLWAHRGLISFYARTTVESDRVVVGRADDDFVAELKKGVWVPLPELLAADRQSPYYLDRDKLRSFDAQSWALVHYFMTADRGAHTRPFLQYLALRAQRKDAEALAALGDLAQIQSQLQAYVRKLAFYAITVPTKVAVDEKAFPVRRLSAAEAYAMRAAVHVASERWADAEAALARAAEADPKLAATWETWAVMQIARNHTDDAKASLAKALALGPASPMAARIQDRLQPKARTTAAASQDQVSKAVRAEQSCAGGDIQSCVYAGWAYALGKEGAAVDGVKAQGLLDTACGKDHAEACAMLAHYHATGQGVPKDEARAVELSDKACGLGDANACANVGSAYLGGRGVTKDEARAARAFASGCELNDIESCSSLGSMTARGMGVAKDRVKAKELLDKACTGGFQAACTDRKGLGL
jgi:TPR repeat protein